MEVGAVSGQVEDVQVLVLPVLEPRLKGRGVVDAGIIEHEHRGAGAGSGPGIDDKNRVQGALAGSGVQSLVVAL